MDPMTMELLSRLLDGDLDAAEEEQLERRLAAEPELAAELEALRRLQQQVRAVSERMVPPADLDAILLPLQRGASPPPRRIHPAVRWIGMAAGLALAVTVAVEVARQPAQPPSGRSSPTPAPPPKPSEFFRVKPLPTTATPEEKQPLGAADRLLASPLAEASLPEPEPLDVRGPLAEDEVADEAKAGRRTDRAAALPTPPPSEEADSVHEVRREAASASEDAVAGPAASAAAPASGRLELQAKSLEGAGPNSANKHRDAEARLVLMRTDGTRAAEVTLPAAAAAASSPLVVTVADGVIVGVEAEHEGALAEDALTSIRGAVGGRTIPGLADGRYRATIEPSER